MSSTTSTAAATSNALPKTIAARAVGAIEQQHGRHASQDADATADDDGDDVFSNPDTAELEWRSDATGSTSPAPNSPGPGSPTNRNMGSHLGAIASSPSSDPYSTLKHSEASAALAAASDVNDGATNAKPSRLAALPQTNIAQLQQQLEQQQSRLETPRALQPPPSQTAALTPTKQSPRPGFGRTLSASGINAMQSTGTSMHATHSASGGRMGPTTPRIGGHASSQSVSHLAVAYNQLPSAHGLPLDPREASTMSKLFAHPPAQSPAEEYPGFMFTAGSDARRGAQHASASPAHASYSIAATPAMGGLAARRLSRPATRPSSPERHQSPNVKSTPRVSVGALGLGLSTRVPHSGATDDQESSIFERDIEHRDAAHVLSKQEAMDVAIPNVLDDAVEAMLYEDADQLEIVQPHAALPPLALSTQALSAHSSSQIKLQQQVGSSVVPTQSQFRSSASSPHHSPPLASASVVEPPLGSMAAQIAERMAAGTKTTSPGAVNVFGGEETAAPLSRHRRPNSDVSLNSASSSMRSRSPHAAPLSIGVQQVMAASTASPRSATSTHSARADHALGASTTASRVALPTATALPALPLPNPYRSHSPSASVSPLPDGHGVLPALPSVSMDGAVMPSSESATMDASFGSLADVIASQPQTSSNSLANSPSMRLRGLALDDMQPMFDASPYSSRSPVVMSTGGHAASGTAPNSPLAGRRASTTAAFAPNGKTSTTSDSSYVAPLTMSAKKRLSFFSYADIINQTPGEVMNFDEAVRQTEEATIKNAISASLGNVPSPASGSVLGSPTAVRFATNVGGKSSSSTTEPSSPTK